MKHLLRLIQLILEKVNRKVYNVRIKQQRIVLVGNMRLMSLLMGFLCAIMFNVNAFDPAITLYEANFNDLDIVLHVKSLGLGYKAIIAVIINNREEPVKLLEDSFYGVSVIPHEIIKKMFFLNAKVEAKNKIFKAKLKDNIGLIATSCLSATASGAINFLLTKKSCYSNAWKYSAAVGFLIPFFFYKNFNNAYNKAAYKYKKRKEQLNNIFKSELLFNPPVLIKPNEKKEIMFYINTSQENNLLIDVYDESEKQTVQQFIVEII